MNALLECNQSAALKKPLRRKRKITGDYQHFPRIVLSSRPTPSSVLYHLPRIEQIGNMRDRRGSP